MKNKAWTLICCLFLSLTAMAQEHLSFKGIPVAGSLDGFCQKLSENGFSQISLNRNLRFFVGDFTGHQVRAVVTGTDDEKSVRSFALALAPSQEWKTLVATFNQYKDLYVKEYGKPAKLVQKNPSKGKANDALMKALEEGKVTYAATWKATEGTIEITIVKTTRSAEGMVVVRYRNTQVENAKKNDASKKR